MPLYEYYCKPCDHVTTELLSVDEERYTPVACMKCFRFAEKILSATKGKVPGSDTPVKQ